jgi:hypothetical protein
MLAIGFQGWLSRELSGGSKLPSCGALIEVSRQSALELNDVQH